MFGNKKTKQPTDVSPSSRIPDFAFLSDETIYLDSACQSIRPKTVTDALQEYYAEYNACGGRVKYKWGQKVDLAVEDTRLAVLRLLGLSPKTYATSFTLNTTYGINLLLQQLPHGSFSHVVTSEIEHNSVFLPTMTLAKRLCIERLVLPRSPTGELIYQLDQLENAIVVVNAMSNIDGRQLGNIKQLIKDTHDRNGIVIIDAAQAMAHSHKLLIDCDADAICFSAHKMYAPSLGVVVAKKALLDSLDRQIIGGGMVSSVTENDFELVAEDPALRLEPGLQAFGEIIAFGETIRWLENVRPFGEDRHEYIASLGSELYEGLKAIPNIDVLNKNANPVVTISSSKIDAHRLAIFLSSADIMVRSGYFCCHYYLQNKLDTPPLLRFSVGLHNTHEDIKKTISIVENLIRKS